MNFRLIAFFLFFLVILSCENHKAYQPAGLRKLTDHELMKRARNENFGGNRASVIFKDSLGRTISEEELIEWDPEVYIGDQYVNDLGEVIEIVLRKVTPKDQDLLVSLQEAFDEGVPIALIEIDCEKLPELLEAVLESDQGQRQGENDLDDASIDRKNQQIVVSVIENCGFPTVDAHGQESVYAVFLVIQHASKKLRETYFPLIKTSAEQGDLPWNLVALMEDRMLMDRGEKQKYGSQVQKMDGDDQWRLYPIDNPENVNQRRAEVGLGPIEDYLKIFEIEY